MSLELLSADESEVVIRGNWDGRIWSFGIELRNGWRELVERDQCPARDYPPAYRFAYEVAVSRELVDAVEGE